MPLEDRVTVRVSDWLAVPLSVPVSEADPVTLGDADTLWDGVDVMLRERLCERVLVCDRDTERLCVCVRVKVRACVDVALGVAAALWLWLADWDAELEAVPLCEPEREDERDAVPERLDVRDALCVAVTLGVSDELALCEMVCVTLGLELRVPETLAVPDWDSSVPDGLPVGLGVCTDSVCDRVLVVVCVSEGDCVPLGVTLALCEAVSVCDGDCDGVAVSELV